MADLVDTNQLGEKMRRTDWYLLSPSKQEDFSPLQQQSPAV